MIKRGKKKIQSDYGMNDYYLFYKNTYDSEITKAVFNKVVTQFNEKLIDLILNESFEYTLPHLGLSLTIRKDKRSPKLVNGKVVNNAPVDWVLTKKLWANNEEAKQNKVLVRYLNNHTNGYVFRIYCKKFGAQLKNRSIYKFKPSRKFQRSLSARIKDLTKDKFETYLLYNN